MSKQSLRTLFVEQLKDIYSAERQLVQALGKMADAADNEELQAAFSSHLEETHTHISRLEEAFAELEVAPEAKTCQAMKGLIKESDEAIATYTSPTVRDVALIAAAQRVEHYEIASYGTLSTLAWHLDELEVRDLLKETLVEETNADVLLTRLAEGNWIRGGINQEALAS